jgi:hypothetical protein
MHFRISRLGVAATMAAICLLLLWAPLVHAQAQGPGTLIGEDMISTSFTGSGSCSFDPSSQVWGGSLSFFANAAGSAGGPYPGLLGKHGFANIDTTSNQGGFLADFFITGITFNQVRGQEQQSPIPNTYPGGLICFGVSFPDGSIGSRWLGDFQTPYSAFVLGTSCQMNGTAYVNLDFITDGTGAIIQSFIEEYILTSSACAPPVGPPARVMLQPLNAVNPVGTSHTVIATVTDINGNPVPNTTVDFTVTGVDNLPGSCNTDQNGQCSFTYQGPQLPGADAIRGCVNTVTPSVCGDAAKEWILPASTQGQVTGGGQIMMPPTDKVSFGFNAQSDGTTTKGNCNVIDHDKRIHIKCDNVQALVVAGTHATFFGQADQDGVTTNYRIDVDDLAEPGAGMDTFKIQTDKGYIAGGFLTAGNITIHK